MFSIDSGKRGLERTEGDVRRSQASLCNTCNVSSSTSHINVALNTLKLIETHETLCPCPLCHLLPMEDIQMSSQKPFRFLELPLEVRNAIYNVILCSPPPPKLWPLEQQDLVGVPDENSHLCHLFETQILRVNHQIYSEAKDVMLRGNQFIRIRGRGTHGVGAYAQMIIRSRQIPILATTPSFQDSFNGIVMTYIIDWAKDKIPPDVANPVGALQIDDVEFVILRRDLDVFCETLALLALLTYEGFDEESLHIVEIHNPFHGTLSPDFMSETNQERLLQPFCDHLQGFKHMFICGHVSPQVSEAVPKRLANEQLTSPEEALVGVQNAKDKGNTFFRRREFYKAAAAYWKASIEVRTIKRRSSWSHMRTQGGVSFVHALAGLYHQISLNAAQNILTCLRENFDPIPTKEGCHAIFHIQEAMNTPRMFDLEWAPTLAQMAKANYRMACVQRAMGDAQGAKVWIDEARLQAPSDEIIRREAEEIEAETRAQAGLGRLLQ